MAATLFRVTNRHVEDSGEPPTFDDETDGEHLYRSYFENSYGEQWVFLFDSRSGETAVYGGDCGWDKKMFVAPLRIAVQLLLKHGELPEKAKKSYEAQAKKNGDMPVLTSDDGPIVLNAAESLWLQACIAASGWKAPGSGA